MRMESGSQWLRIIVQRQSKGGINCYGSCLMLVPVTYDYLYKWITITFLEVPVLGAHDCEYGLHKKIASFITVVARIPLRQSCSGYN